MSESINKCLCSTLLPVALILFHSQNCPCFDVPHFFFIPKWSTPWFTNDLKIVCLNSQCFIIDSDGSYKAVGTTGAGSGEAFCCPNCKKSFLQRFTGYVTLIKVWCLPIVQLYLQDTTIPSVSELHDSEPPRLLYCTIQCKRIYQLTNL